LTVIGQTPDGDFERVLVQVCAWLCGCPLALVTVSLVARLLHRSGGGSKDGD
jgi:hypothetical protein